MAKRKIPVSSALIILFFILMNVSCVPHKELRYFNDINELEEPKVNPRSQKVILPFDNLYIRVLSIDPQTSQIFNASEGTRMGGQNTNLISYLVDEEGNINFPFVGKINVGSLTTAEAADKIQNALSDYVSNISVSVKFIDNRITVLGEVQTPGVYNFTQDKLNIYDVLGLGGGITRYGDRENVILVRNEDGKIKHYRLNLSESDIASKNTYYIYNNDVIIVEPLKAISSSYSNVTYSTILTSITTVIAVLLFIGVEF
jgi:polysaccharide export outer membrane protein